MDCQRVTDDELVEKYLNGQLDPAVQDDFEIHILECSRCLIQAEAFKTIRASLASKTQEVYPLPAKPLWGFRLSAFGIAAALVVICIVGIYELHPGNRQPTQAVNIQPQSPRTVSGARTAQQETKNEAYLLEKQPPARRKNPQRENRIPTLEIVRRQRLMLFPPRNSQLALSQQSPEAPNLIVFNFRQLGFRPGMREGDAMELISRDAVFDSVNR